MQLTKGITCFVLFFKNEKTCLSNKPLTKYVFLFLKIDNALNLITPPSEWEIRVRWEVSFICLPVFVGVTAAAICLRRASLPYFLNVSLFCLFVRAAWLWIEFTNIRFWLQQNRLNSADRRWTDGRSEWLLVDWMRAASKITSITKLKIKKCTPPSPRIHLLLISCLLS